jgi:hypothetical protein
MRVAQRGTSFTSATTPANSDDTYLLDRWILLSDVNDTVDVSQSTTVIPTGAYASMKLEVETANRQFGILQVLEARDAARFIGGYVSLSFQARMAASDDNTHSLKAVILSWNSTADTVTSDVVNVWGATPTYVANWTAENTPASNTLTTTWTTFEIENVYIDTASTTNIAVFIFCDQTDGAIDDAIIITGIQLELGSVCTDFEYRAYEQELALCQRYYEKWETTSFVKAASAYSLVCISWKVSKRITAGTITVKDTAGTSSKISTYAANNTRTDGRDYVAASASMHALQVTTADTDSDIAGEFSEVTCSVEL